MLTQIFNQVLTMSFVATLIILVVIISRELLKRAPKIFAYILWGIVLFRLLCPISIESNFSIMPAGISTWVSNLVSGNEGITDQGDSMSIQSDFNDDLATDVNSVSEGSGDSSEALLSTSSIGDNSTNNITNNSTYSSADYGTSNSINDNTTNNTVLNLVNDNPLGMLMNIFAVIWLLGIVVIVTYNIILLIRLRMRLKSAILIQDNIYSSNHIDVPFVMGIIVPKIYIPSTLDAEAKAYVIHHEKMHIRRKDHLIRFISFIALVLHWFNPSVWMAFILSGKDMEMSCDEAVLKELGTDIKKHYSNTLLSITTGNSRFRGTALTLAFGEHDVKSRIKNILNYKKPSTWLITITVILTIVLSVTLLTNPHTLEGDFPGGNFGVKDIVYTSPQYSFTYQLETAPVYAVSSDYVFYSKEKDDHEFNLVGYAYKVKLSEDELLQLFLFEGSVDEHMASILKNIKNIYRVDDKNSTMTYLILGNDKGDIFIASGYRNGNEEMESVRWLFEMERIKLDDFVLSATELWQYRTEYLGDNSAVAGIISGLEFPEELTYTGFSLKTKDQPYGITIDLSASNDTVINLDDLTKDVLLQLDACIFFSLVGNVENITFSIDGGNLEKSSIGFSRGKANEIAGMDLWEESSNEADYSGMLLTIKEVLSSGGNDIIDVTSDALIDFTTDIKDETTNDISDETINETTGIVSDEELLERAISEAILTYNTKYGTLGAFNCESHVILATTTNELVINDTITVYAQVLFQSFDKQLIGLNNASGSFSTNVITFNKDENGTYELVEYWVPRDGSYYESDIRDKFPDDMEEAALDTQKNIVYQMQACYKQAIEALDVNTTKAIEALLDTIMSSPMESSSPYDYTLAHPIEYRELTYYGDYTLAYIEDQLSQGETGLKAKIMEILYNEMTSAGE